MVVPDDRFNFGSKLKAARAEKNMTQVELARLLHVNRTTVSNWENGRRQPGFTMIQQIATRLNVSVAYLLGEADDPSSQFRPFARNLHGQGWVTLPIYRQAAQGHALDLAGKIEVPANARREGRYFYCQVLQPTMTNCGVFPGDILLFMERTNLPGEPQEVALVQVKKPEGGASVEIVHAYPAGGDVRLEPDPPTEAVRRRTVGEDQVRVLGWLVRNQHWPVFEGY